MSYIGNTNTTQGFTPAIDYFSGNASTTAFTLSRPVASVAQVQAVVNNVAQNPSDAFTVNGNTITFTSAPSSGTNNIYVYYTSPITQVIAPSQGTVGLTALTATGTPSSSTYLRGDNAWAAIASSQWTTTGSNIYYNTGNVGIGTSSPRSKLSVTNGTENTSGDAPQEAIITGANQAITAGLGILTVQSNTGIAADVGATIALGGRIRSTGLSTDASNFAVIKGAKENATSDNSAGYFAISTKPNGVAPVERMRIDSSGNLQFNSGYGSVATAYGCRAWVNFNGTGTVAIRASGNVSSITDNGTGDYTVNFTAAVTDSNFSYLVTGGGATASTNMCYMGSTVASSSFRFAAYYPTYQAGGTIGSPTQDASTLCVSIFR